MFKQCEVPLSKLKKQIDISKFSFQSTKDIEPLKTVIGQKRAVSAISFALEMNESGYNIFVTGSYGTGRTTIVTDLLQKRAKNRPTPSDWAFVYNFNNPDEPLALELAAGKACAFRSEMQRLIQSLKVGLKKAFESKSYTGRKTEIIEAAQQTKHDLYSQLEKDALEMNIQIKSSSMGFVTIPLKEGKAIESEDFEKMSVEERETIERHINEVQRRIQELVRKINRIERTLQDEIDQLNEDVARFVVDNYFAHALEEYEQWPEVVKYLRQAADDIVANVEEFIDGEGDKDRAGRGNSPYKVDKYKVNVVIDNSDQKGAPVIYETNPTYNNLFGRIDKKTFQGYVYTDYTMIKAGSILAANGGYLLLDADQLLKQPFAYEALKRALRSGKLRIEDVFELYGYSTSTALRPSSVPLNLKVVLIGQSRIYHLLHNYDEEFRKIFKVRADFDYEVEESPKTIRQYMQFISRVVHEENLRHFSREAVAAVIEYGFRTADHQRRLSIRFGDIVKIIRESSFWAGKRRHRLVKRDDVEKAIEEHIYRHDLVEEKVHTSITEKTIKVDVDGEKVGQINGLAVYNLGDYSFGRPTRITVNTYIGSRGIINIEREAKMSGRIHDKGVLVLNGYFSQKFGADMPLSFAASITFEQNYGTIDGDSASCAELYCLLSSLSGIPLAQGIAVTGSVNQKGEVQAIGGVNEKIEGFFKVCKARKLTGKQGVIIPTANVKNLLLSDEVVEAVKAGKFTIWAVDKIEDGMRILTGRSCGRRHKDGCYTADSIFEQVRLRLVEFARRAQEFRKNLSAEPAKEKENDEAANNE